MKQISILGSTGSIGKQTLDVVREHKEEFKIVGLSTNTNVEILKKQVEEFEPLAVSVINPEMADLLKKEVDAEVYSGIEGLKKISSLNEADTVVNSLVGSIGILPTLEAIKHKKDIAMANKETLVTAGEIVMREARQKNVNFIPIDSEHNAMLQCLKGDKKEDVKRIIITCSGGPFRNFSDEMLKRVTLKDALNHPTWNMGAKITVDCATLMNKGFEVIETHWLYDLAYEDIEVVIHPESIVHAMIEFSDRSTIAQMSLPDMKLPIQYALSYPKRLVNGFLSLDITKVKTLNFSRPDFLRFPCLKYAYDAAKIGGSLPAVLNAANESAVKAFIDEKIGFCEIAEIVKREIDSHKTIKNPEIEEILEIDEKVKKKVNNLLAACC